MMFLILFLFAALLLWISSKCIYNVYFHPLRSYPGPWLCRASSIPRIWHRTFGTNIPHAHRAHQTYGPVVRLSPTELSYITSDAWNDIYARHGGNNALPKEPAFNTPTGELPPGLVQVVDGAPHARQRRVFAPAFTNTALKKQEEMILGHVRKLVAIFQRASERSGAGAEVNVTDVFNFLTFDVMADLSFGRPLGLLDAEEYSPWVKNVLAVFQLISIRGIVLFYLPQLKNLMLRAFTSKAVMEKRQTHIAYAAGLVDQRLDQGELDRPDIWTLVERKQDLLTRPETYANAATFMAAGTETITTSLCGVVWFLTNHRERMDIARKELRSLKTEENFTMESLAKLEYLNAVINESMRLYPPTPDMLYRLVPEGGADICGKHVPAGMVVGVHQYPAYHSALNFHRPEEFLPERWLPSASENEFANDDRKILQPFSKGPRTCIGKNLAMHEIRLALAHILWHFDIFVLETKGWMEQQKTNVVWEKPPLILRVSKVN